MAAHEDNRVRTPRPRDARNSCPAPSSVHDYGTLDPETGTNWGSPGKSPSRRVTTAFEEYGSWRHSTWTPEQSKGTARMMVLFISVFADIGPGQCLFVFQPMGGLAVGIVTLAAFGCASLFGAHLVAVALTVLGCDTLTDAWKEAVGRRTAFIPMASIMFVCFACAVALANSYGNLFSDVVQGYPLHSLFGSSRAFWTIALAVFPMSGLVMMKDISIMWYSTALAGLCSVFMVICIFVRFIDGSYGSGGTFAHEGIELTQGQISAGPHVNSLTVAWTADRWWQLFSVQPVVFLTHFNAAKYFRELKHHSRQRYTAGVGAAMSASLCVIAFATVFTALTFGNQVQSGALDNYSKSDTLMNVVRIAVGIGLMGCFPLLFAGMREALVELLNDIFPQWEHIFERVVFLNALSLLLLAGTIAAACATHGVNSAVIHLAASGFGSLLIYFIPGAIYVGASRRYSLATPLGHNLAVWCMMAFGLFVLVLSFVVWCQRIAQA